MTAVSFWPVLATLAVAIVLGLSAWALHLQVRLAQQRAAVAGRNGGEASCAQRHAEVRRNLVEQLHRLAQVALADDVNLSEASIRARYLLDHLDPEQTRRAEFAGIYRHYEAVSGFAIRSAREALSAQERRRQDLAREALEAANAVTIREAMQALLRLTP